MIKRVERVRRIPTHYGYDRKSLPMQKLKSPFRRILEKKLRKIKRDEKLNNKAFLENELIFS